MGAGASTVRTRRRRDLLPFGLASLVAVAAGCVIVAAAGGGAGAWGRNLGAWLLGAGLALLIARRRASDALGVPLAAAIALGLVATCAAPAQDGVHRWWDLGPLHINAALLLLPLAVVALVRARARLAAVGGLALAITALLVAQPDASQATAFGLAVASAIAARRDVPAWRWGLVALLVGLAGAGWLRPDPLAPVAEVEEIVQLGWRLVPAASIVAVLALAAAVLAPLRIGGAAALPLALYAALTALAPAAGAFPVPLVGLGMSPVLGLWLGIGLLAAGDRGDDIDRFH